MKPFQESWRRVSDLQSDFFVEAAELGPEIDRASRDAERFERVSIRQDPNGLAGDRVVVLLDEQPGLRLPGRMVDIKPDDVEIGMRVQARIEDLPGGDFRVVVFAPL